MSNTLKAKKHLDLSEKQHRTALQFVAGTVCQAGERTHTHTTHTGASRRLIYSDRADLRTSKGVGESRSFKHELPVTQVNYTRPNYVRICKGNL